MTTRVEKSIMVNVPVSRAYNQWTQFEDFPQFMEGVERIEQKDDTHLHWVADIAGTRTEWDAEITEQIPDERVAWKNTTGATNAGVVTFHRLGDDRTKIMLQLDAEGDSLKEKVGDALGLLERRVKGDLGRFKEMIEAQGAGGESGAWRGEVNQSATQ